MDSRYPIFDELEVPAEVVANWQLTADLLAELAGLPAALIMRVHARELEVFVSSHSDGNLFRAHERAPLDTGRYCETVLQTRRGLTISNAKEDPAWRDSPEAALGMIAYQGLPLTWPNGELFGTICILDNKENQFAGKQLELMERFRESIELTLANILETSQQRDRRKAVEKSNRRFRKLIDLAEDAIAVVEPRTGRYVDVNNTMSEFLDVPREDLLNSHVYDFSLSIRSPDEWMETAERLRREGHVRMEDRGRRPDGSESVVEVNAHYTEDQGEEYIVAVFRDIEQRKQAEEALRESENFLQDVFDAIQDGISVLDTDLNVVRTNRWMEQQYSHQMPLVDKKCFSVFQLRDTACPWCPAARTLETGQSQTETVPYPEASNPTGWIEVTVFPVKDETGKVVRLIEYIKDVTERKKAEEALQESERRFKTAGMAAYDLIYEWDTAADSLEWYGDVDEMLGYRKGEISRDIDAWLELIHPDDVKVLSDAVELHRNSTQPIRYEYRILHHDGEYRHWSDHALPLLDDQGRPYKWIGACKDITVQKENQRQLEHIAHYDTLTNLPNRVLLIDRLHQAMAVEQRRNKHLAVVYIDLDGFKSINDAHGHDMGDRFLVDLANRLKQALRKGDTIARLGGDEFVAVLIDIASTADCVPLLKRLLQATSQPVYIDDLVLQVSASLGVSFYPQSEDVDPDQLLRQSDQAMYQAKLSGKNRYHIFDAEHDRSLRGQHESLQRIRQAMAEREFLLYYQPKVNMRTGQVVGTEALIRWQHPEQGLLSPALFLPVLEDQPLAVELGERVIDAALTQMEAWYAAGLEIPVSVNISARQLQHVDFIERLRVLLDAHPDVPPGSLELEVLETSALEDLFQVSQIMYVCRKIGVSFALDDFGTGYSSLTYLKHLPAATLKIDRAFVRDMLEDPDDLAILEGIVGMSDAFHRHVIAEGVETVEHGELLLKLGCELAQGYGIARPMPARDLVAWIEHWRPYPSWKAQKRISRDDLPLLFADIEHRAWTHAVEEHIKYGREEPPLNASECRFGQWLNLEGKQRLGGEAVFKSIVQLHSQLHQTAQELCELNAGELQETLDGRVSELHGLRDLLLEKLNLLVTKSQEHKAAP